MSPTPALELSEPGRSRLIRNQVRTRTNAELGRDPTQTTTLRRSYAAAHSKRFRDLKGALRTGVADRDVLGLSGPPGRPATLRANIDPPDPFDFPTDAQKAEAFREWLDDAVERGILAIDRNAAGEIIERAGWQQTFVQRGYLKGITHADVELARAGVRGIPETVVEAQVLQAPIHHDSLELLYTRNFRELEGITASMDQEISRRLADGLSRGLNPRTMATRLNAAIDTVGIQRARTLARTEIIRAHAQGTLRRFRQFGIQEVAGQAEFATAGDDRVCPICVGLEGEIYELKEAEGVIPVHPNCRCTWLPVVRTGQSVSVPGARLPG